MTLNKGKVSLNQAENLQLKGTDYHYLFNTAKTLRLSNGLIKRIRLERGIGLPIFCLGLPFLINIIGDNATKFQQ